MFYTLSPTVKFVALIGLAFFAVSCAFPSAVSFLLIMLATTALCVWWQKEEIKINGYEDEMVGMKIFFGVIFGLALGAFISIIFVVLLPKPF